MTGLEEMAKRKKACATCGVPLPLSRTVCLFLSFVDVIMWCVLYFYFLFSTKNPLCTPLSLGRHLEALLQHQAYPLI